MNILPKTPGELLEQVAQAGPFISFGAEADSQFATFRLLVQGEVMPPADFPPPAIFIATNPHTRFTECVRTIDAQHSRGKRPLQQILDNVIKEPANEDLIGGQDNSEGYDYGYVGALRKMKLYGEQKFYNLRTEAEKRVLYHPEWLSPEKNGLVLNHNSELATALFPNGNYLLHTTDIDSVAHVLDCGQLTSTVRLMEHRLATPRKETHGGDFGISCSCNGLQVVPGTLGHLAGFMTSPEEAQKKGTLFVPVDASTYELLFIRDSVNVDRYKELQAQRIIWQKAMKEFMNLDLCLEHYRGAIEKSNLMNTIRKVAKMARAQGDTAEFRAMYQFKDGQTVFDPKILETSISPLAVLVQSSIDGGDAEGVIGRKVNDIYEMTVDELQKLIPVIMMEFVPDEMEALSREIMEVGLRAGANTWLGTEEQVFVCSEKDLESVWKYVFAHSEKPPRAVLVFNGKQIRVPDFTLHKGEGDHQKLECAIRQVIPRTERTFNWHSLFSAPTGELRKGAIKHFVPATVSLRAQNPKF